VVVMSSTAEASGFVVPIPMPCENEVKIVGIKNSKTNNCFFMKYSLKIKLFKYCDTALNHLLLFVYQHQKVHLLRAFKHFVDLVDQYQSKEY
jgi:hypothetical protein